MGQVGIRSAFESPDVHSNAMEFLRQYGADNKSLAAIAVVPKDRIAYPQVRILVICLLRAETLCLLIMLRLACFIRRGNGKIGHAAQQMGSSCSWRRPSSSGKCGSFRSTRRAGKHESTLATVSGLVSSLY